MPPSGTKTSVHLYQKEVESPNVFDRKPKGEELDMN